MLDVRTVHRPRPALSVTAFTVRVELQGAIDASRRAFLEATLREAEDRWPEAMIVVDLSAVERLDATAGAVLIDARRRAEARGRRLIVGGGERSRDLLRAVSLEEAFEHEQPV